MIYLANFYAGINCTYDNTKHSATEKHSEGVFISEAFTALKMTSFKTDFVFLILHLQRLHQYHLLLLLHHNQKLG